MQKATRFGVLAATCLALCAVALSAKAQDEGRKGSDRPKLIVTARPAIAIAPARIVLTAQLVGGSNDFEEYYCPTVIWDWDDGTRSESTSDCDPYEPGVSSIRRRFTTEHRFQAGSYRVLFSLENRDKEVAASVVRVQVRPGLPN
jgi:hypothetical protein